MKLPVSVRIDPGAFPLVREALAHKQLPRGWRPSAEYAMTKATAVLLFRKVEAAPGEPLEAEYFDWSCLLGELARYHQHLKGRARETRDEGDVRKMVDALALYGFLRARCFEAPGVAQAEEEGRLYEREGRKLRKAARRLERIQAQQQEREAAHRLKGRWLGK
jgi:hypothetical protein